MSPLDPSHPTVVRRRVVVDVAPAEVPATHTTDEPPPSSIFAPPEYNQPDSDLDEEDLDDDDEAPATIDGSSVTLADRDYVPPPSIRPTVHVGARTSIGSAARQLGLSPAEATAELVRRGLFAVSSRSIVSREAEPIFEEAFHCRLDRSDTE